jgi:predicted metal-dependent hydrolase
MEYCLIRAKRRTAAIYIRPNGTVEVRAPLKMSKTEIDRFVDSKEKWIKEKLLLVQERTDKRTAFCLDYGDSVLMRGREYPIVAKAGNHVGFDEERFYMPPGLDARQIKAACVQIYKLVAKQHLTNRTLDFAEIMGVMPSNVKINSAKTRWGSCSAEKSINYAWRLVMAEDDVIDYVVVHELSHITEMNHSARFWAIVAKVLPDYDYRQQRLKALQQRLGEEDWE